MRDGLGVSLPSHGFGVSLTGQGFAVSLLSKGFGLSLPSHGLDGCEARLMSAISSFNSRTRSLNSSFCSCLATSLSLLAPKMLTARCGRLDSFNAFVWSFSYAKNPAVVVELVTQIFSTKVGFFLWKRWFFFAVIYYF